MTDTGAANALKEGAGSAARALLPRIERLLRHRNAAGLILILAVLLPLPAVFSGWETDDLVHKLVLQYPQQARELGLPNSPTAGGLFTFLSGDPGKTQPMMDRGLVPWWTHPEAKSSFFRPLTFLTHWLDYRLWPESPRLMHLHSLVWYGLLVAVVMRYFHGMSGPASWGMLAALLYAIDDAHATPVGWIANRSAILTTLFGVLAVDAHHRACRGSGARYLALWSALWLLAALLCGEGGTAAAAFLVSHVLLLDKRPLRQRATTLIGCAVAVMVWMVCWSAGGYGTYAVGMYTNPFGQPASFVLDVISRLPVILLSLLLWLPADTFLLLTPPGMVAYSAAAAMVIALFAVAFWRILRGDRLGQYFALSLVVAALPACAAYPSDRNLMFVGVAAMGLLARIMQSVGASNQHNIRPISKRLVGLLVLSHMGIALIAFPVRAAMPLGPERINRQLDVPSDLMPFEAEQTVVLLNNPSSFHAASLRIRLALAGLPAPNVRALAPSLAGVRIEGIDEHTFTMEPYGVYVSHPLDRIFRGDDWPLTAGQIVSLAGLTVSVEKVVDGAPTQVRFHFDQRLEDPSFIWIQWEGGRFVRTQAPAPGEMLVFPPSIPK